MMATYKTQPALPRKRAGRCPACSHAPNNGWDGRCHPRHSDVLNGLVRRCRDFDQIYRDSRAPFVPKRIATAAEVAEVTEVLADELLQ